MGHQRLRLAKGRPAAKCRRDAAYTLSGPLLPFFYKKVFNNIYIIWHYIYKVWAKNGQGWPDDPQTPS